MKINEKELNWSLKAPARGLALWVKYELVTSFLQTCKSYLQLIASLNCYYSNIKKRGFTYSLHCAAPRILIMKLMSLSASESLTSNKNILTRMETRAQNICDSCTFLEWNYMLGTCHELGTFLQDDGSVLYFTTSFQ